MIQHLSVYLLTLLMVSWTDAYTESCVASLSTMKNVTECPTDRQSYEKAAHLMNCSPMSDSCKKGAQYHCVLNSELNGLVEVCATSINVFGKVCPKFDENLKGIIRIYDLECQNFSSPCPLSYNSTETYKYPGCYTLISYLTSTSSGNLASTTNIVISASKDRQNMILIIVIVIVLIVALVISLVIFLKRRSARQGQQEFEMIPRDAANPLLSVLRNEQELDGPRAVDNENIDNRRVDANPENRTDEPTALDNVDNPDDATPNIRTDEPRAVENENIDDPVNENGENRNESSLQALAKVDVNTLGKDNRNRILLKCSMTFLTKSLIDPVETWSRDKIIQHVKSMIKNLEDAKETDLLVEFIKTIDQDPNIQTTLIKCGVEMFELISSVQERYKATKVEINSGCVCFVFSFADDQSLNKLLNDFYRGEKSLKNCISRILLNQTFLGIFQIHPETVTWKAREVKVYKGSELLQENLEVPLVGTYKDTYEDVEGAGYDKNVMVLDNLTEIYRDILDMEVPHANIVITAKSSNIYEKLSQAEKDILSKAVQFGYSAFNIPFIYKLLRHICFEIHRPTKGWGVMPSAEDTSLGDDIERVRYFRNAMAHTTFKSVSQELFDGYLTIIADICHRMQNYTGKNYLESLKKVREEVENDVLTPDTQSSKEDVLMHAFRGTFQEEQSLDDFKATLSKYPAYKHVKTREKSFDNCKDSNIKERASELSRDGFYYEGYDLVTTCFHCGIQKGDWKKEDDIHAEHVKLNQECDFVKYVELHILKTK